MDNECQQIKGLLKYKQDNCTLYIITELSDELKQEIRNYLAVICYGEENISLGIQAYSYQNTLKEFVQRCTTDASNAKKANRIKGMMGELLTHLILRLEKNLSIASSFFNIEERSFKKGFDIVLVKDSCLWITEIKSGEKHVRHKNATQSIDHLLTTAQKDLAKRLSNHERRLWDNAINAARNAMSCPDEKKAVLKILATYLSKTVEEQDTSKDYNVILAGNLFHPLTEKIAISDIQKTYTEIQKEKQFNDILVIATQQETFKDLYDFLQSEAQQCQKNSPSAE